MSVKRAGLVEGPGTGTSWVWPGSYKGRGDMQSSETRSSDYSAQDLSGHGKKLGILFQNRRNIKGSAENEN